MYLGTERSLENFENKYTLVPAGNKTAIPRLYSLYHSHCTDWATLAQLHFVGTQIRDDKAPHIYRQLAQQMVNS